MQDCELITLIKNNPNSGLDILMKTYMALVCTVIRDKIGGVCDEFEMESCASDVFIEFYNNIDKFDTDKGSIKTFLCLVAKRRAIDQFRKKAKELCNVSLDNDDAFLSISDNTNVEEEIVSKEMKAALMDAVKGLGEPDSEIIIRKFYLGENSKQISDRLSMTVSAIDTRASRALKKLRTKIAILESI